MSQDDSESWSDLESAWQESDHRPETTRQSALIARLGRRRRWIDRAVVIGELLVVLIFGSLAIQWLWTGSPAHRVAGGFVLTLLVVVSILRRRAWFGRRLIPADAPARFVHTLLERNAAGYRAVRLAWGLLAVQVVFFAVWLPWSTDPQSLQGSYVFLVLWTGCSLVTIRAAQRYLDRERRRLKTLRDELDDG